MPSINNRLERLERVAVKAPSPPVPESVLEEFERLDFALDVAMARPAYDWPRDNIARFIAWTVRRDRWFDDAPPCTAGELATEIEAKIDRVMKLSPAEWWAQMTLAGYDRYFPDREPKHAGTSGRSENE